MRYLLFSWLLLLIACSSEYKALQSIPPDQACYLKIKPSGIQTCWFSAHVEVVGKHISGLLLIKNMPDSSKRVVFTNEAGVTFFDFEFQSNGTFQVKQILKSLNKKPVIETLRKDFELILGLPFQQEKAKAWRGANEIYFGVSQKKETAYVITDLDCASLRRLEIGSTRKRKVAVILKGADLTLPDSVEVKHFTFNMVITLKKLERP